MGDAWQELEDDLLQIEALVKDARKQLAELGITRPRHITAPGRRTWCHAIEEVLTSTPQTVSGIAMNAAKSMDTSGRTKASIIGHVTNELNRKAEVMGWKVTDDRPMRWFKDKGGETRGPF